MKPLRLGIWTITAGTLACFASLGCGTGINSFLGLPNWTGIKQMGAASKFTIGYEVATDPFGNVYASGYSGGALNGITLIGNSDAILVKLDPNGTVKWTRNLGVAAKTALFQSVAAGYFGVAVAGSTTGNLATGSGSSTGTYDLVIAMYDLSGNRLWAQQLGVATKQAEATKIAVDAAGNLYIVGNTTGGLDGNTLVGTQDYFIAKYNSAGVRQWVRQSGASGNQTFGLGVAVDSSGNVYAGGYTFGSMDGVTATGTQDAFLVKYDPSGNRQWTKLMGVATKVVRIQALAASPDGSALYGFGISTGNFDGNTLAGTTDSLLMRFDLSGTRAWSRQRGASGAQLTAKGVRAGTDGKVYLAGYTDRGLDGHAFVGDSDDAFAMAYDTSGTWLWTRQFGSAGKDTQGQGVVLDPWGEATIVGSVNGPLGGNALTGVWDLFLARFNGAGVQR